jgi:integrase
VLTVDDNGTPLRYTLLDKAWRRIRSAANIDNAHLHDFRHTVGTFGAQAGLNSFMLRDALGHKTVAMTAKYVERHADTLRIAVEPVAARIASAMRGHSAQIIRLEQQKETSR